MSAEILLFKRLNNHHGTWMPRIDDWIWTKPSREPQGFGLDWRIVENGVGRANLLWLALDMERPPDRPYDWRYHNLCVLLITAGPKMELGGLPLFSQAEALTLAQFRNLCDSAHFSVPAPYTNNNIALLLVQLANRRLEHAHT